jgi:hypothetical protein
MARDEEFLEATARVSPGPQQLEHELEIARQYPSRRLTSGEYVEEIALPNGHTWRRNRAGQWCRFSDEVCLTALRPTGIGAAAELTTESLTARAAVMRTEFSTALSRRPAASRELNGLVEEITRRGNPLPPELAERLWALEDRLGSVRRAEAISTAPSDLPVIEVTFEANNPYYALAQDTPLNLANIRPSSVERRILEFPDGTRVWSESATGPIVHEAAIGPGPGRAGFEHAYPSRGAHGNLPPGVNWERAHSLGQGTGFESPFGLRYAPSFVNQRLQNEGVELLMRQLVGLRDANTSFRVITRTTTHADGLRLAEMSYRVEVLSGGQAHHFFDYRIRVDGTPPFRITAQPISFANNPVALAQRGRVSVPERLSQSISVVEP